MGASVAWNGCSSHWVASYGSRSVTGSVDDCAAGGPTKIAWQQTRISVVGGHRVDEEDDMSCVIMGSTQVVEMNLDFLPPVVIS